MAAEGATDKEVLKAYLEHLLWSLPCGRVDS
jgi:hypothetical protein